MDQHLSPYRHPSDRSRRPSPHDPAPSYRVGEVERAAACDALAEHYAAGRLDPAELDDRLARAMAARTQQDLRVLFIDLGPRRTPPAAVVPVTTEGAPPRRDGMLAVIAAVMVMSLLLAGGMLLVLGAYSPALCLAALVGGTATGIAGACATVLVRGRRA